MKTAIAVATALFTIALWPPLAYGGNTNGVYLNANWSADVHHVESGVKSRIDYQCHDSSKEGTLKGSNPGTDLVHCKGGADLEVHWLAIDDTYTLKVEQHSVSGSQSVNCNTGEAGIWMLHRCDIGPLDLCTLLRQDGCEICAYSGGPCE